MTTNEIEEIVHEFQKKFVHEEKDENIRGWHFKVWEHPMKIIDWLIPTLTAYGEKCREEEKERIKLRLIVKLKEGLQNEYRVKNLKLLKQKMYKA